MKNIDSVNKFRSIKEWEEYVLDKIVHEMAKAGSAQEIRNLLDALLTAHEKRQIIRRASAISFLRQGKSYSEIGELLWLSPQTISAIRKSMRAKIGYMSNYERNKKVGKEERPLTKEEWRKLKFSLWFGSLFVFPPPPLRHPRLMSQLGYSYRFPKK